MNRYRNEPLRRGVGVGLAFALAVLLGGCRPAPDAPLTPVPATREALTALLTRASGTSPRPYMTFDFGRDRDQRAVSVVVPRTKGVGLVHKLRPAVPAGWLVFVGTDQWLGDEKHKDGVEVVIGPGSDQFDILRLARSDAINYGLGTEDLIRKLKGYDATVGLDILQANTDTVVSQIGRQPSDPIAFADDVYAFCPDIVDQGTGSVAALRDEIQRTNVLFLWWD